MTDETEALSFSCSYHDWEDDGQCCGLQNPEYGQADDLHQGEEVGSVQGDVTQERQVGLVLGWHQEEFNPVPELWRQKGTHHALDSPTSHTAKQ